MEWRREEWTEDKEAFEAKNINVEKEGKVKRTRGVNRRGRSEEGNGERKECEGNREEEEGKGGE